MRIFEILFETNHPPEKFWVDDLVHMASYARYRTFKTEQEARDFVQRTLDRWDESGWGGCRNGECKENNKKIADATPLYMSGKSFKIGKRIRPKKKKQWEGIDIERPSLSGLLEVGLINPFDVYEILGMKMVPVKKIHMTEDHSLVGSGVEHVYELAELIKENGRFTAIIIDEDGAILDGHHRYRVVCDIFKWGRIPALVIRLGG